jgi:hypothetical protein
VVAECVKLVRDKIGPVAAFKLAVVVDRLPKTRSGKILRGTMVKIADGESYKMPATIDDPAILDEIGAAVAMLGYGSAKGRRDDRSGRQPDRRGGGHRRWLRACAALRRLSSEAGRIRRPRGRRHHGDGGRQDPAHDGGRPPARTVRG